MSMNDIGLKMMVMKGILLRIEQTRFNKKDYSLKNLKSIAVIATILALVTGCTDDKPTEDDVVNTTKDYIYELTSGLLTAKDIVIHSKEYPTENNAIYDISYYLEKNEDKFLEIEIDKSRDRAPLIKANLALRISDNGLRRVELRYVRKNNQWEIIRTHDWDLWQSHIE